MKTRWKISLVLLLLGVCWIAWQWTLPDRVRKELDETRRLLREQGFKFELADFNFSTSPELRARAAAIGTTTRAAITSGASRGPNLGNYLEQLSPITDHSAIVLWREEKLRDYQHYNSTDVWPELRQAFEQYRSSMDQALQAAISGPIRFEPIGAPGPAALLPYLSDLRRLETAFGSRTILTLHDGDAAQAWTNLLASTCLVTEYSPEPIEICCLVRFGCAGIAFETLWNALNFDGWSDAQLGLLQGRWEAVDLWTNLLETVAYRCADAIAVAQNSLNQPVFPGGLTKSILAELIRSPRNAWAALSEYSGRMRYARYGFYKDQKAFLLFSRDRASDMRRAIQCQTWSEMRQLPGVLNPVPFVSSASSAAWVWHNQRGAAMNFAARGKGILGMAAEAEARRRLILTALALERHRLRHGHYPQVLAEIDSNILKSPLADFMDGKPLRYRLSEDGHFTLYSVGLDCADDGGKLTPRQRPGDGGGPMRDFGLGTGTDLVWPLPASQAERDRYHQEQQTALDNLLASARETEDVLWWDRTAKRQSHVERILKAPPTAATDPPRFDGRALTEILQLNTIQGKLTLPQLLTLTQIKTGDEPEFVTFELPIKYDALTNIGSLELYIDPDPEEDSDEGQQVSKCDCFGSSNGSCRLVWNTIYEAPGNHALMAGLDLGAATRSNAFFMGPLIPFAVSNLCQFSPSSAYFQPGLGADLRAKSLESNCTWSVEIKSPDGRVLRNMAGRTEDGIIKAHWNLQDNHRADCTNAAYDTVWRVTLPDSGRSQILRGP